MTNLADLKARILEKPEARAEYEAQTPVFESIKRGLLEDIEHADGSARETRIHRLRPVDVKALRAKLGMTQEQFAARFGFSTATLRHWERGDRTPHGPALVLLNVIERNPAAVIEALTA
jgi:putative transcriptional regulator